MRHEFRLDYRNSVRGKHECVTKLQRSLNMKNIPLIGCGIMEYTEQILNPRNEAKSHGNRTQRFITNVYCMGRLDHRVFRWYIFAPFANPFRWTWVKKVMKWNAGCLHTHTHFRFYHSAEERTEGWSMCVCADSLRKLNSKEFYVLNEIPASIRATSSGVETRQIK